MLAIGCTCEIRVCIRVMRLGRLGTIDGADRLAILTFIGGQIRAHFFKSVHKSAKCAFGRKIAHFFDVL